MKKFFLTILFALAIIMGYSQEINGVSTRAQIWSNEQWTNIENGQGIPIWVNAAGDRLSIKSKTPQYYYLYNLSELHVNNSGHQQIDCNAINRDGENFYIRFVVREDINGSMQIYLHNQDFDIVYDVTVFPNE